MFQPLNNSTYFIYFICLTKSCLKFKLGFSCTLTEKFQIYKLGFEEAVELEIKLQTFVGSWRKQGSSRKTSTSASLTMLKSDPVDHNQTTLPVSWETSQGATIRTGHGTTDSFKIEKDKSCILSPCLFNLRARVLCAKYWAGWRISWNQNFQEKYQQPQICKSHHSNGRNWRETKELLDEGEREEWKSWLETQYQKKK